MFKKTIIFITIFSILIVPVQLMAQPEYVIDEVVLEPKDPILGTVLALGPGFFVHGWGHFYAEDYKMGLTLAGTEILSIGLMAFGYIQNTDPYLFRIYGGNLDENRRAGALTFGFGFVMFMASYLADVMLAGKAAQQYNKEHGLQFRILEESYAPGLMMTYNF